MFQGICWKKFTNQHDQNESPEVSWVRGQCVINSSSAVGCFFLCGKVVEV